MADVIEEKRVGKRDREKERHTQKKSKRERESEQEKKVIKEKKEKKENKTWIIGHVQFLQGPHWGQILINSCFTT